MQSGALIYKVEPWARVKTDGVGHRGLSINIGGLLPFNILKSAGYILSSSLDGGGWLIRGSTHLI